MNKVCKKGVLFLGQAHAGRHLVQARTAPASVVLSAKGTGSVTVFITRSMKLLLSPIHSRYCSALKLLTFNELAVTSVDLPMGKKFCPFLTN